MELNKDALNTLELKLAEYGKENGGISIHESMNNNDFCHPGCSGTCDANCSHGCRSMNGR